MDYGKYLTLYSGGSDSTYFIENEPTAKYLIHYEGRNDALTKLAVSNANILDRYITVVRPTGGPNTRDGETNQIHALYDTQMVLDASIRAASHGMLGVVVCFNSDDIGIDVKSLTSIMRRAEPHFEILQPLITKTAASIRTSRTSSSLKSISCMSSEHCGHCAKCLKTY